MPVEAESISRPLDKWILEDCPDVCEKMLNPKMLALDQHSEQLESTSLLLEPLDLEQRRVPIHLTRMPVASQQVCDDRQSADRCLLDYDISMDIFNETNLVRIKFVACCLHEQNNVLKNDLLCCTSIDSLFSPAV